MYLENLHSSKLGNDLKGESVKNTDLDPDTVLKLHQAGKFSDSTFGITAGSSVLPAPGHPITKEFYDNFVAFTSELIGDAKASSLPNQDEKEKLYSQLTFLTGVYSTPEAKTAVDLFFGSIARGGSPDENGDGKVDYKDIVEIWKKNGEDINPRPL